MQQWYDSNYEPRYDDYYDEEFDGRQMAPDDVA